MALETDLTLQILTILTALICVKFYGVIFLSGIKRTRAPEDMRSFPILKSFAPQKQTKNEAAEAEDDGGFDNEQRWRRIVQNDMENIPITLILLWASVYMNGNNETNVAFASIFFVARTIHTFSYVYSLQPWRTIAYLIGFCSTFGFIANMVHGAFK